jgi:hypothetical protein
MAGFLKRLMNRRKDRFVQVGTDVGLAIAKLDRQFSQAIITSSVSRVPGLRVNKDGVGCLWIYTFSIYQQVQYCALNAPSLSRGDREKFLDAVLRATFNSHFEIMPPELRDDVLWKMYSTALLEWAADVRASGLTNSQLRAARFREGLFENPTEETADEVRKAVAAMEVDFRIIDYVQRFLIQNS